MDPPKDDAWGDFKSSPEQAEAAPAVGLHEPSAAAAAATIVPPVVEQIPPQPHQAATAAVDNGSESAAGRGDGSAADLLGSLPDPMFSGSGGSIAVAGGEDLFASTPAVAEGTTVDAGSGDSVSATAAAAAAAAAARDLLHEGDSAEARACNAEGEKADDGSDGERGVFEQPVGRAPAEAAAPNTAKVVAAPASSSSSPEMTPAAPPAEKLDGEEWIDLAGAASTHAEGGEGGAEILNDDGGGDDVKKTLVASDEGTAPVNREEPEPPTPPSPEKQRLGDDGSSSSGKDGPGSISLMGDFGCRDNVVVAPAGAPAAASAAGDSGSGPSGISLMGEFGCGENVVVAPAGGGGGGAAAAGDSSDKGPSSISFLEGLGYGNDVAVAPGAAATATGDSSGSGPSSISWLEGPGYGNDVAVAAVAAAATAGDSSGDEGPSNISLMGDLGHVNDIAVAPIAAAAAAAASAKQESTLATEVGEPEASPGASFSDAGPATAQSPDVDGDLLTTPAGGAGAAAKLLLGAAAASPPLAEKLDDTPDEETRRRSPDQAGSVNAPEDEAPEVEREDGVTETAGSAAAAAEGIDALETAAVSAAAAGKTAGEEAELAPLSAGGGQLPAATAVSERDAEPAGGDVIEPDDLDWGDLGGSTGAVEAAEGAAVDRSSEAEKEEEEEGSQETKREQEEAGGRDEWLAFEAPPAPSSREAHQEVEPPAAGDAPAAGPTASVSSVGEEAKDGHAEMPSTPPAQVEGKDQSGASGSGKAGDDRAESVSPGGASAMMSDGEDSGAFDEVEPPSSEKAPAGETAGRADNNSDGGKTPFGGKPPSGRNMPSDGETPFDETTPAGGEAPSDGKMPFVGKPPIEDDEKEPPPALPELEAEAQRSSGWGAFDEAPPPPPPPPPQSTAADVAEADAAAEPRSGPTIEADKISAAAATKDLLETARACGAITSNATSIPAPPTATTAPPAEDEDGGQAGVEGGAAAGVGAGAETTAAAGGGSGQEPESEDDWGSDFGDFEEAPTPEEEAGPHEASAAIAAAAAGAGTPCVAAPPTPPPQSAAPAVGVRGEESTAATAGDGGGGTKAAASAMSAYVSGAAGVRGERPSLLAVMVTVFDEAFDSGGSAEPSTSMGIVTRGAPSLGGGAKGEEGSLDSRVDLAPLLRHAHPYRSRAPARLHYWAAQCILRGIRPVPDALALGDADDADGFDHRGRRSSGRSNFTSGARGGTSAPLTTSRPRSPPPSPSADHPLAAAGATRPASSLPTSPVPLSPPRAATTASSSVVSPSRAPRAVFPRPSATAAAAAGGPRVVSPSSSPPPVPPNLSTVAGASRPATTPKEGLISDAVAVADQALSESVDRPVTAAAAAAVAVEPTQVGFASFPAPTTPSDDPPAFDGEDDDFVWGEAAAAPTPEMPRHPPPRVPQTPPAAGGASGTDSAHDGVGDGAPPPPNDGGDGNGGVADDGDGGGGGDGGDWSDDAFETFQSPPPPPDSGGDGGITASGDADDGEDGDWSDDPFDTFQSAPPAAPTPLASPPPAPQPTLLEPTRPAAAAAAERSPSSPPPPPTETLSWNLDFLMGLPAKGAGGDGGGSEVRVSPLPGGAAGVSPVGGEGMQMQSGKPMDLVSQALAGFGIASTTAPGPSQHSMEGGEGDGESFGAFSGGEALVDRDHPVGESDSGGGGGGGGGGGERGRVGSVEVSDLLRAARLRGGGRRSSRPMEPLSAEARARLAGLPDLSYMLSQRIRFPMRAAAPVTAAATGAAATGEALL